ncbi:MAG: HlyD family type I secretion periplasmic adaptor subunit [Aquabacterium sp.]|nr:HlyD family type I secretion periplasmic adaptor subunit [Aquabacterium sp.]
MSDASHASSSASAGTPGDEAPRHPLIELLARYRAIFAAAWARREELAGPKRLRDETAFLPAALSLQETPPHPAPRRAIWAIVALFSIAVAWACIGEVDIVAVAHGRIVVSDRTKIIQPLETSVVKAIHVRDGDKVQAGQVLIELDATAPQADTNRLRQEHAAALSESLRSRALIDALQHPQTDEPRLAQPSGLEPQDHAFAAAQLQAEWGDIRAKQARLDAEIRRRQAEIATVQQEIAKLQATLPLAQLRERDFLALSKEGFIANHAGQDKTRERIELERDLATQRARLQEAQAALAESQRGQAAFHAETLKALRERLAQADVKRTQAGEEGIKAEQRKALTRLTAPVAGTVQQLAVHTPGGVVTPAQALMVVVPDNAEVTAEVEIENKDIGFVEVGQQAEIKLEAFPYTEFGTIQSTVQRIAADSVYRSSAAIEHSALRGTENSQNELPTLSNSYFPTTLRLSSTTININGKNVYINPGIAITAEIKIGRRKITKYVLAPLMTRTHESFREK